jgi:hypothetical protein
MVQGENGLADPMAFALCLLVFVAVLWLWTRFMGQ